MPSPDTRLMTVFSEALERSDPAARAAYLDDACRGNPELRRLVEALLAAHVGAGRFLEPELPAAGPAPGAALPESEGAAAAGPDRPEIATVAKGADGSTTEAVPMPPPAEAAGTLIAGRYKLLQLIGEGGMGSVWMAEQTEPVRRRLAVKLIRVERGQSRTVLSRFEAERQAIALMDHPHIARLLDAGATADGSPFFVMELVKGIPLNDYCDHHRLGIRDRLQLFTQVCSAVQHAHQKGIIHRDLKPTNILVESHDGKPVPKVIDFGLAKATSGMALSEHTLFTAFGSVMGTPLYMAPEQASFNAVDVDTRADVYALGVILYELLTGTTPITRESMKQAALDEMLRLICEQDAPTPSSRLSTVESTPSVAANRQMEPQKLGRFVKGELDWIVMKALSKERDRRYETPSGFARDIERFLNNEAVAAGPPSASYRLRKFVKRNRRQVIAASLVLVALLAGMVGTTWGLVQAERARREEAVQRRIAEAERLKAQESQAQAEEQRARAEKQRARAEARETQAIDAVKRFRDAVSNNPELKNNRALESLRKTLLREPMAFFKTLRDQLQADGDTRPKALARLAQAAYDTGNLTDEIGDKEDALRLYREALVIQDRLARENPSATDFARDLAGSHHNIGHLLTLIGRPDAALASYRHALAIRERLARENPSVTQFASDLAQSHNNAGYLQRQIGRHDLALQSFRKARAIQERLVQQNPSATEVTSALARSNGNIGILQSEMGHRDEALRSYRQALAIFERLARDNPSVTQFATDLAHAHHNIGGLLKEAGQRDEALLSHRQALAIRERLAREHPTVTDFARFLARSHYCIGQLKSETGHPEEALQSYRLALAIQERLARDNSSVTDFKRDLALSHDQIGMLQLRRRRPDDARASCRHAAEIQERLAREHPESPDFASGLGGTLNNLALIDVAERRFHDAQDRLREAVAWQKKALAANSANPTYRQYLTNHLNNMIRASRELNDLASVADAERELAQLANAKSK
jgi:serine/threonine-protein kinase